jgi:photosystem II stability/assembly factor-like uncharacterized protein
VTNHRDPIDAWLGADVEPLPPPPGAFERVHRRARRRKTVRAISAASGAAVIVAAAATLPQLAHGLLGGPSGGPAQVRTGSPGTTSAAGSTTASPQPSGRQPARGPALLTAGTGPEPAAGFRPVSVTFVSPKLGAVLGQAGSCGTRPCMVMAGTPDYGTSWSKIGAPLAGPADGAAGVSQIRFLDASNGWAYGPALYATHDGGASWHRVATSGRVIDLSAVAHRVFAVIASSCTGPGSNFAAGCSQYALYSAASSSDRWQAIHGATARGHAVPGSLQLSQDHGYLIVDGRLYAGPLSGAAWHRVAVNKSAAPSCLTRPAGHGPWLVAPTTSTLFLACAGAPATGNQKLGLYVSLDGGHTWRASGATPAAAVSLTASPTGTLVLATRTGIYFSPDARTWRPAKLTRGIPRGGFAFVGMTTDSNGVAVPANLGRALYVTTNGGRTWRPSPIR